MKIAFTGHRPQSLGGFGNKESEKRIKDCVMAVLIGKMKFGEDISAISGMALGVDQWAAEVCNELKIPWEAYLPYYDQDSLWSPEQKKKYRELLLTAVAGRVISDKPTSKWDAASKLQKRNESMVDDCDILIAVWNGSEQGGTYNCIKYAKKKGRTIIYIDPKGIL